MYSTVLSETLALEIQKVAQKTSLEIPTGDVSQMGGSPQVLMDYSIVLNSYAERIFVSCSKQPQITVAVLDSSKTMDLMYLQYLPYVGR